MISFVFLFIDRSIDRSINRLVGWLVVMVAMDRHRRCRRRRSLLLSLSLLRPLSHSVSSLSLLFVVRVCVGECE